ncbi:MAG: RDD family protein, partial [Phycisphaerae bacterium]
PDGQKPLAAVGWNDGVFVLTRGPARPPATAPNNTPTTAVLPAPPAAITAPTTAGALPTAPAQYWTLYRYTNRKWLPITLGPVGAPGWPASAAQPVLIHQPGQVTLAWFNPDAPRQLYLRPLGYAESPPLQFAPQTFAIPEDLTRLQAVSIGPESFLFWPAHGIPNATSKTNTIELHGLALRGLLGANSQPADRSAALPLLKPLDLTALSTGIDPLRDISVARTGNSFIAVVAGPDGNLQSILFDTTGKPLEGPSSIKPQEITDSLITQNVIMVFMLALLALSLWQWRIRSIPPKLPKTVQPAYLRQRLLAAAIDLALPLLGVIIAWHLYRDGAWMTLGKRWFAAFQDQELWGRSPDLLWTLGLYIAHVTLSELAFGRSLGKAILGIRVVAIDGSRPRPMAIILRNLVRAIEVITGVLLIYVLLNDLHQRLGDLLARTVVVRDVVAEAPDAEKP